MDTTYNNIRKMLVNVYMKYANIDLKTLGFSDEELFENYGLNSVDFIKVIVGIETEFNFEFEDDELDMSSYRNLNDLIMFIQKKILESSTISESE